MKPERVCSRCAHRIAVDPCVCLDCDPETLNMFAAERCGNCDWHEEFSGACCNGDSDFRADFTADEFRCDKWEG